MSHIKSNRLNHNKIIIYCDGACSGNQYKENAGGWGAILSYKNKEKRILGGERNTTNQRMELTACIKALSTVKRPGLAIEVFSDSAYMVNCMHKKWYEKWEKNGWITSKKDPVENKDLWVSLLEQIRKYNVTFFKVKGHSGDKYNEIADELAREGLTLAV